MSNMIKILNTLVLFLVSLNIYSIEVLEVEILDSYQLKKEFPGKLLPVEQSKLAFEIIKVDKKINKICLKFL